MKREFSSGSRQAPDPIDQFLEQHNYYRKHTARDSTCLFRVASEQIYDTQQHHLAIRKKCVAYMRKHRQFFQPLVDRDLDDYLDDLSKPKTYGTLLELQAVGFMYERTILLFEAFNLGNYFNFIANPNGLLRVFYTPERHFDSVFTADYIKDAAICQSICYEILYQRVFQLPDVSFAVEQMLHGSSFEAVDYYGANNEQYCARMRLQDGREFELDLPHNTKCILDNYKLCHFHNHKFSGNAVDIKRELRISGIREDYGSRWKTVESALPNKFVSCVRQLLQEGITPFPYKVAKALDPHMYRNIEFDVWNETRKEIRLHNWYHGDTNFKVGAQCRVKLHKSDTDLLTGYIQEISLDKGYCVVFVEKLGERRVVPYESLVPLPLSEFKPWTLPYRVQRQMDKYDAYARFTRHINYRLRYGSSADMQQQSSCYYRLKQYMQLDNFRPPAVEYCTMPLTLTHGGGGGATAGESGGTIAEPKMDAQQQQQQALVVVNGDVNVAGHERDNEVANFYDTHDELPTNMHTADLYANGNVMPVGVGYTPDYVHCMTSQQPGLLPTPNMFYFMYPGNGMPSGFTPNPSANAYVANTPTHAMPYSPSMFAGPPPNNAHVYNRMPEPSHASTSNYQRRNSYNNSRHYRGGYHNGGATSPGNGRVNYNARKSLKPNGNDLPCDVATVRYFYNLGVEHYQEHKDSINDTNHADAKPEANSQESKSDTNNNNMDNMNDVTGNATTSQQNDAGSNAKSTAASASHALSTATGNKTSQNNYSNPNRRYAGRNYKERYNYNRQTNSLSMSFNSSPFVGARNNSYMDYSSTNTPNSTRHQIEPAAADANENNSNGGGTLVLSETNNALQALTLNEATTSHDCSSNVGAATSDIDQNTPIMYSTPMMSVMPPTSYDYAGVDAAQQQPTGGAPTPGNMYMPYQPPYNTYGQAQSGMPAPAAMLTMAAVPPPQMSAGPYGTAPPFYGHMPGAGAAAAPPTAQLMHPRAMTTGQIYGGYYAAQAPLAAQSSNEMLENGGGMNMGADGMQPYQYPMMSGAMPVYFTSNGSAMGTYNPAMGAANSGMMQQFPMAAAPPLPPPQGQLSAGAAAQQQQGYWCMPPPPPVSTLLTHSTQMSYEFEYNNTTFANGAGPAAINAPPPPPPPPPPTTTIKPLAAITAAGNGKSSSNNNNVNNNNNNNRRDKQNHNENGNKNNNDK